MHDADVVVIGGGGAGVAAAAAAAAAGARVLLLSKEPVGGGDTRISEGAVAFPGRLEGDSTALFVRDVFKSGDGLSRPELVLTLAEEAWRAAADYEAAGAVFKRDAGGHLAASAARHAGGHTVGRSLVCSGSGVALGTALRAWAVRLGVPMREGVMALRILVDDGAVAGVQVLDLASGEIESIPCRAVVVATGSAGWLYDPHTDCTQTCAGDGYAMALAAGARLVEMEQVQFLPFACVQPPAMVGVFVGDTAMPGPYGVLRAATGEVLLDQMRRRTRAEAANVIALAALKPGQAGPNRGVFLDLSPNLAHPDGIRHLETLRARGTLETIRKAYGPEAAAGQVPFEVLPTAHYNMGGVLATVDGESNVPGLYAAGGAMGGMHGGNRLGTVALAEILVFGRRAGAAAARRVLSLRQSRSGRSGPGAAGGWSLPSAAPALAAEYRSLLGRPGAARPIDLIRHLQRVMWDRVGITRTEQGLQSALAELDQLATATVRVPATVLYNAEWRAALQFGLMLQAARMIALSALARRESRGAHVRLDYPGKDAEPQHVLVQLRAGVVEVDRAPVPPPPALDVTVA